MTVRLNGDPRGDALCGIEACALRRPKGSGAGRPRHRRAALLATGAALALVLPAGPAAAQALIDYGTVVDVPGTQASPWNVGGILTVGNVAEGTLHIGPGGSVTDTWADLGVQEVSALGTVTVSGSGALWSNSDRIALGVIGRSMLSISDGGHTEAASFYAGVYGGSSGAVTVDGTGSLLAVTTELVVGDVGVGRMELRNGGKATSNYGYVGYSPADAVSTVAVGGGGAKWEVTGDLSVGHFGKGEVNVASGGEVAARTIVLGSSAAAAEGKVTVDGGGAFLTATDTLYVGYQGKGELEISHAGLASAGVRLSIGAQSGSIGTVTVDGAGSVLSSGDKMIVGDAGRGFLAITNGGYASAIGEGLVGSAADSSGRVDVTQGGQLVLGQKLTVGDEGLGVLNVSGGGTVTVGGGHGTIAVGQSSTSIGIVAIGGGISNSGPEAPLAPGKLQAARIELGDHGDASLYFNHTGTNYLFAPQILGVGTVNQIAGFTALTADSSAFSGLTVLQGGTLAVDGALGGTLQVLSGGTLQGTGTVGGTTVWGTLAPGNSIGTLSVAGDLAFKSGSIYAVEVNAAGQSDLVHATGTATIEGGTVRVLAGPGSYGPSTQYTILSADGGVNGTFSGVTSNFAFLDPTLSCDSDSVFLTLTPNGLNFAAVGFTPNQIATGGGAASLGAGNPVYDALLTLSTAQARAAFDLLSGEIHASARTVLIEDARFVRTAAIDRLRGTFGDVGASQAQVMAYAADGLQKAPATTPRAAVWAHGFGSWGQTDGDGNAARLDRSTGGFFIGADALAFDAWRFGVLGGYSRTAFDVDARASSGASDNYYAGLYGGTKWGALAFRSGGAFTWSDISTSRAIAFPGFSGAAASGYGATTAQAFGEFGYGVTVGALGFEPFANLAWVNLHTDGFREIGSAAALIGEAQATDTTFTTLGLRATGALALGGLSVTASGTLGWRHAFGALTPLATLAFAGGTPFTIAGVPIARDAAVVEAGLDMQVMRNTQLGLFYGGQFGGGASDQSVRANINVAF